MWVSRRFLQSATVSSWARCRPRPRLLGPMVRAVSCSWGQEVEPLAALLCRPGHLLGEVAGVFRAGCGRAKRGLRWEQRGPESAKQTMYFGNVKS